MILLIDNYDSFTYNLYQSISLYVQEVQVVRNDQITISQIKELNPKKIIISPGPGRPEDAGICLETIDYFKGKIPILGICLGHQAIAQAFGSKIISCHEILQGKVSRVYSQGTGLFSGIKEPYTVGRYHSLCVDKSTLPKELQIDAISESGVIMAISHSDYPIYGLQFHPESFLTSAGNRLIEKFASLEKTTPPQLV